LNGLLKPKKGTVIFNGVPLDKLPAHKIVELGISLVACNIFPLLRITYSRQTWYDQAQIRCTPF
ncbi:MAG: hypothetical protein JG781_2089, partial [Peptococcaceae bacterium]|nr:hypothetical protein [Peptococcaceae bacterium]